MARESKQTKKPRRQTVAKVSVKVVEKKPPAPRGKKGPHPQNLPRLHQKAVKSGVKEAATAFMTKERAEVAYAAAALEQLVDPQTAPLLRTCTGGTGAIGIKTALAKFSTRFELDMQPILSQGTIPQTLPQIDLKQFWALSDGYFQMVMTDDPLVPLIYPARHIPPVSGVSSYVTDGMYASRYLGDEPIITLSSGNVTGTTIGISFPFLAPGLKIDAGADCYGAIHPMGCSPNTDGGGAMGYFWVDANDGYPAKVTFSGTLRTAVAGVTSPGYFLTARRLCKTPTGTSWEQPLQSSPSTTINAAVSLAITLKSSGYYAFSLAGAMQFTATANVLTLATGYELQYDVATLVVSRHVVNTQILDTGKLVQKVRVNGSSLLCSNTTPNLYKGGVAYGYSATQDSDLWYSNILNVAELNTANTDVIDSEPWTNGIYGYVRPLRYGQMVPVMAEGERGGFCINGDFADPWGWSVISIKPSVTIDVSSMPLQLTQFMAVEYITKLQAVQILPPRMSVEAYNLLTQAMVDLKAPFSCNPSHISQLWAQVRAAVGEAIHWAIPVVGTGLKALSVTSALLATGNPLSVGLAMAGL